MTTLPDMATSLTIGQCATLACLWEATVPKPGNVHRGADFDDLRFTDFLAAAVMVAPAMDRAVDRPLGRTVLDAVRATRELVATNVNLGIILLIAPLASVPRGEALAFGVRRVLTDLSAEDAALVYEAIRVARPGGLGSVEKMDVADRPPANLLEAMAAAQDRDLIAKQYVTNFQDVFHKGVPWLIEGQAAGWSLSQSIIHTHLRWMAEFPDSLIARKAGGATAEQSRIRSQRVLESGPPGEPEFEQALADLDFWLRSDGRRRNPGTTADMVAASLFAALRDQSLPPPWI